MYHILTYDDRDDLQTIGDYEMGDFDLTEFWQGQGFEGAIPAGVRLYVDEMEGLLRSDILANPVSWLILSNQLWSLVSSLTKHDVQVFEAPVFRKSDGSHVSGYKLINPIRLIECLDMEKSTILRRDDGTIASVIKPCIKARAVKDHHMFRIKENRNRMIVSDELAKGLAGKDIRGVAFVRCLVS
jgi:hypothetical protein